MTRLQSLIPLIVLACAALPLTAQEKTDAGAQAPAKPPQEVIPRRNLSLTYHPMSQTDTAARVLSAVKDMFGRDLVTEDGKRRNLFLVGRNIAVFDTPERAEEIIKALPGIESAMKETSDPSRERQEGPLETRRYLLKYAFVNEIKSTLGMFQRQVPALAGTQTASNLSYIEEQNAFVLRDIPQVHETVAKLLVELDRERVSRPDGVATITCQILRACDAAPKDSAPLPKELVENLTRLGSWKHFELMGTGIVRISTNSDKAELSMDLGSGFEASLMLEGVQAMPNDMLSLGSCRLMIRDTGRPGSPVTIKTGTRIPFGQYTVIGAAGRNPFLLVLTASS